LGPFGRKQARHASEVRRRLGWTASVVGRHVNNCAEGDLAEIPREGAIERSFPDVVLMRFEAPVEDGDHHKILAVTCPSNDLTLI
jgi:hypothetical protein